MGEKQMADRQKTVMVVDAQGGGLGKQIIMLIRKEALDAHVIAVGTNFAATSAMMKAGADEAATGENAVRVVCRKADLIIGPVGMVIADAMLGEITPEIARSIVPFNNCDNYIAGVSDFSVGKLITDAVRHLAATLEEDD